MAVRKGPPFWNKYELENNNQDTLHKNPNVFNIFSIPLGMYDA